MNEIIDMVVVFDDIETITYHTFVLTLSTTSRIHMYLDTYLLYHTADTECISLHFRYGGYVRFKGPSIDFSVLVYDLV